MNRRVRRWAFSVLPALACFAGCQGCLAPSSLSADQAFALSASALAGSDRYSFSGEAAAMNAEGAVKNRQRFHGEVAGHRTAALSWSPSAASSAAPATKSGDSHPLSLAETIQLQAAAVAYDSPIGGDTVALKVALKPEAAKARAAKQLRSELERFRPKSADRETSSGPADDLTRSEADKRGGAAATMIDEAISTLKATTLCRWTADRRTWFPRELREETVLRYRQNGRWQMEKRTAVIYFRKKADGAIISQEEGQ